jgi:hypothetical protein
MILKKPTWYNLYLEVAVDLLRKSIGVYFQSVTWLQSIVKQPQMDLSEKSIFEKMYPEQAYMY